MVDVCYRVSVMCGAINTYMYRWGRIDFTLEIRDGCENTVIASICYAHWYAFEAAALCMVMYVSLELHVVFLCTLPTQGRKAFLQHGLQLRCAISIVLSSLVLVNFV
jgi:hypothetical protein